MNISEDYLKELLSEAYDAGYNTKGSDVEQMFDYPKSRFMSYVMEKVKKERKITPAKTKKNK